MRAIDQIDLKPFAEGYTRGWAITPFAIAEMIVVLLVDFFPSIASWIPHAGGF